MMERSFNREKFTVQGVGDPVPAFNRCVRTGPVASSSSYRNDVSASRDRPVTVDGTSARALAVPAGVRTRSRKAGALLQQEPSLRAVGITQARKVHHHRSQPSSAAGGHPRHAATGESNVKSSIRDCSVSLKRIGRTHGTGKSDARANSPARNFVNSPAFARDAADPAGIRIIQLNASRASSLAGEVSQLVSEKRVDILLLQEPYVRKEGNTFLVAGLGVGAMVAATKTEMPWAAVVVTHTRLHATYIAQLSTSHCACAEISSPGSPPFYVISQYFQYQDDPMQHVLQLERVLYSLRGKRVLIGADVNQKSPLWSPVRDPNRDGASVEELIASFNLHVLNDVSQGPTFQTGNGSSYVDLTLASPAMSRSITGWNLRWGWAATAEHAPIEIGLGALAAVTENSDSAMNKSNGTMRFNARKADWEKFEEAIKEEFSARLEDPTLDSARDVENYANTLANALRSACARSMPRRKHYRKSNPWWNPALGRQRKLVGKLRKEFQCERDPELRKAKTGRHRDALRNYKRAIRGAKKSSFENYISKEGNRNPWGFHYKKAAGKLRVGTVLSTLKSEGGHTLSMRETASRLLATHVPDDDPTKDTDDQRLIRDRVQNLEIETDDAEEFTAGNIKFAVKSMGNDKAPGCDLIEVMVLKAAIKFIPVAFVTLFNACLKHGVFPAAWKEGTLRTLLKGPGKDVTNPKSYRPICLLSVVGKLFEKLLKSRLTATSLAPDKVSERQFGFMPKKSTEDAIVELDRMVKASEAKYTIGILFDISGAFDNVWWPLVLQALADRDCPKNVFAVIRSYFDNRDVKIEWADQEVSKRATRGCPQGSVLGPACWNLMFDGLLKTIEENFGEIEVAYADDLITVIRGESRKELETLGQRVVDHIQAWCASAKLELSESKTEAIVLKRVWRRNAPVGRRGGEKPSRQRRAQIKPTLDRNPVIKLNGRSIKFCQSVRYLGVHFDKDMKVKAHVEHIHAKTTKLFNELRGLANKHWGIRFRSLRTVFRGVFEPVASYAAAGWHDKLDVHDFRRLRATQRNALLTVTNAYRTASHEALCTIAGVLPVDLLLEERKARYFTRIGRTTEIGNIVVDPNNLRQGEDGKEISAAKEIKDEARRLWKVRFENAEKGRIAFNFFPDVVARLEAKWVTTDHWISQVLSGHGQFLVHLHRIKGHEYPETSCECGTGEDDVEHFLLKCPTFAAQRECIAEIIGEREWPEAAQALVANEEAFEAFAAFCRECVWLKYASAKSELNE